MFVGAFPGTLPCRALTSSTGVTNDLQRRLAEHRSGLFKGYTFEHSITRLVHFEVTTDIRTAISREKQVASAPSLRSG
jgi:predicted GIY-YIG superfamily endonuclease